MPKTGTVRRMPSHKMVGTLIFQSRTKPGGSRPERRRQAAMKGTYESPFGCKNISSKGRHYFFKVKRNNRLRNKLAKQSRKLNRRVA